MSHEWAKALAAAGILGLVLASSMGVAEWKTAVSPTEDMGRIVDALFDAYVFPFEVLSVLLLGALIGAIHLGMKTKREEEGPQ